MALIDARGEDTAIAASASGIMANLYAITILTLPVLDWRWMLGLGSYVRPLSFFPILIGLGVYALSVSRETRLPATRPFLIFSLFFCWAILSTILMTTLSPGVGMLKGWTVQSKAIREILALALGYIIYLYFSIMIATVEDAQRTIRLLYIAFIPVALAAFIESGSVYLNLSLANTLDSVLMLFRVENQAGSNYQKIMALAPEASMFADQLLSLFMPFAFAALLTRAPIFKHRVMGISADLWVLVLSLFFLLICGSRTGLLISLVLFGAGTAITIFFTGRTISLSRKIAIIMIPILTTGGAAAIPQVQQAVVPMITSLVGINQSIDAGVWSNITRAGNQVAAWKMFSDYPIAGVGTGAYPFHYADYIPDWALYSPEVQAYLGIYDRRFAAACPDCQITPILDGLLADPKGLIARVAAETGIIGLALMATLWFVLLSRAWRAFRAPNPPYVKCIALGCLLSIIDILGLTFNLSSYVWVHWYLIYAITAALPSPEPVPSDGSTHALQ